ncbi:MAG: hypothetical protein LAO20_14245 [Acidobacteriia bacterium]|nr:hypothetical protein [Terriglobia bacterium]
MIAIREFEVEQGSTPNMSYRVAFLKGGVVVAEFIRPTMQEAVDACHVAGYQFADRASFFLEKGGTSVAPVSLLVLRPKQ